MWIVQLALRRPDTFIAAALVLLIIGPRAVRARNCWHSLTDCEKVLVQELPAGKSAK